MKNTTRRNHATLSLNTRLALGFSGVAMLGFFLATASGPLGAEVYLPLLSVIPVLLALQGGNPLAGLIDGRTSAKTLPSVHTAGYSH
jgi:hypothetical protein